MSSFNDVTVVIVNRKTLELTKRAVDSLFQFCPAVCLLLIDNGSGSDPSRAYIEGLASIYTNAHYHLIAPPDPSHAAGLNTAVPLITTPYFVTLDSDVQVLRGGWIEAMQAMFETDPLLFVVGSLSLDTNSDCTQPHEPGKRIFHFVSPYCAMWDRGKFVRLDVPFNEGGQPSCRPCTVAEEKGYHLGNLDGLHPNNFFPDGVQPYTWHEWGGTRNRLMILEDDERRRQSG